MTLRMTGPDLQAEQGETLDWTLNITAATAVDHTATLRVGHRESVRSEYTTELTVEATVAGAEVDVSLDTSELGEPEYLWEVSLYTASEELVQRWRGSLYVSSALP